MGISRYEKNKRNIHRPSKDILNRDEKPMREWSCFGIQTETRSDPSLFVTTKEVLCLCILEGTAANYINPNQDHHSDNENHIGLSPFSSEISQEASLARVAIVAQLGLVITPNIAVWVSHWIHRVQPQCWVHKVKPTSCWRFTAP